MNFRLKLIFFYCVIILTLIAGLTAIHRLVDRADLPFKYNSGNDKIFSDTEYNDIKRGDCIYSIDNFPVASVSEAEFLLDTKKPGETVALTFLNETNSAKTSSVVLVNYYKNNFFLLISLITGLSYWLTGIYVFAAKSKDKSAEILCLTLMAFSFAIFSSPAYFGRGDDWAGYIIRISHCSSYIFGSVLFLHFTFIFPTDFLRRQKAAITFLYITAFLFSLFISVSLFVSMRDFDIGYFKTFSVLWILAQLFLLLSIISGTLMLLIKYRRLITKNEKAKLEWIFWGMVLGVSPFIIFSLIPSIFGLTLIVNEEIILTFLIVIPISFSIAVIKYQLFDIELVIKRSIIYSSLITLIIFLYFGVIYALSHFASNIIGENTKTFNVLTAVFIALIFNPVRIKVKHFVDSVFYREKYFFDKAIGKTAAGIKGCETLSLFGKFLNEEISSLVPVKSIAIIVKTSDGERLRILEQKNFTELSKNISALRVKKLYSKFKLPFALKEKIDKSVTVDSSLELVFKRWNINLVIPFTIDSNDVIGALVLGDKLSGLKYSVSDIELLNAISSSAALALKRLELQEKLILEELETSKHKELSELKSYFVATVSHDLKTPLASIKIFSELLRNEKISKDKSKEYLEIIEGETDRLGRMINNVLDYARIEKGIKKYSLETINLHNIVNSVLHFMSYEFMMQKFEVEKNLFENDIYINGDSDAINSLLENLFSNAIKYSESTKYIKVSTSQKTDVTELRVEDKGRGISETNLREIFNPFFREVSTESSKIKGAGLGLSIVKYILDAHNGSIEVQSEIGKGSVFKIIFPIYENRN